MIAFSFFKQNINIALMFNDFFYYVLLHIICLLHFFFLCFHYVFTLKPTNSFIISSFSSSFILMITFLFYHDIMDLVSSTQKNRTNAYQHKILRTLYLFEFDTWGNLYWQIAASSMDIFSCCRCSGNYTSTFRRDPEWWIPRS